MSGLVLGVDESGQQVWVHPKEQEIIASGVPYPVTITPDASILPSGNINDQSSINEWLEKTSTPTEPVVEDISINPSINPTEPTDGFQWDYDFYAEIANSGNTNLNTGGTNTMGGFNGTTNVLPTANPFSDFFGSLFGLPKSTDPNFREGQGFGDIFGGGLGSILPIFLLMTLFGGKGGLGGIGKILMPLMLISMFTGGSSVPGGSSGIISTSVAQPLLSQGINPSQVALWALLPKMGTFATLALGGVSGWLGQSLTNKKRRRRSYRSYRPTYYRRRYYRR